MPISCCICASNRSHMPMHLIDCPSTRPPPTPRFAYTTGPFLRNMHKSEHERQLQSPSPAAQTRRGRQLMDPGQQQQGQQGGQQGGQQASNQGDGGGNITSNTMRRWQQQGVGFRRVTRWRHSDDAFHTIMQWLYSRIPSTTA
jgi:hypothetical protein